MDDATIIDFTGRDAVTDPLTDLLRKGARESPIGAVWLNPDRNEIGPETRAAA